MWSWIKTWGVQITACILAQQTSWCRCYLRHPVWPRHNIQRRGRTCEWVGWTSSEMNITGWVGGDWRHQATDIFKTNVFHTVQWNFLACVCTHTLSTSDTHTHTIIRHNYCIYSVFMLPMCVWLFIEQFLKLWSLLYRETVILMLKWRLPQKNNFTPGSYKAELIWCECGFISP